MDYEAARSLLDRLPRFEVKPGLSRIERLLDVLGHPELAFPAVHVAGTNGKGSIVAMLDAVLRTAGYRIGRYTSPDLIDFRDRICVNGQWISEEEVVVLVERLAPALCADGDVPSQFEALTAMAFEHFRSKRVDLAVVEVGLGGRFDATNVLRPLVSVLSNVSRDHTAILGETIEEIAWEKAGIARPGIPLVHGRLLPEAEAVVRAECERVHAIRSDACGFDVQREAVSWDRAVYRVRRAGFPDRIELGLIGIYQRENLAAVFAAIEWLRRGGLSLSETAIRKGLRGARWPGRFEVVRRLPNVVLEGAHNAAGAMCLVEDVVTLVPARSARRLLFGALADKDIVGMGGLLGEAFERAAFCASRSPRAASVERLRVLLDGKFREPTWYDSVAEALDTIVPELRQEETLFVTGSLTVVSEARRWFEEVR